MNAPSAAVIKQCELREFATAERCFIQEPWNTDSDQAASIARARVETGITTQWHYLKDTAERYLITQGTGLMETGDGIREAVGAGDLVFIPAGCRQRITNTGSSDLIFYCICTPRFLPQRYIDAE